MSPRAQYLSPGRENRRSNFLSINRMLVKWRENACSRDLWLCACKRMQVTTMGSMRMRTQIQYCGESWEVLYPTPKKGLGIIPPSASPFFQFRSYRRNEKCCLCPYWIPFNNDGRIYQHDTLLMLIELLDWRLIAHFVRWFV